MTPITEKSISIGGRVFADRRGESRRRVFKGGRLLFNQGYGALECVVRNLSQRGARLSMGETTGVPPSFVLQIAGEEGTRPARVRWRTTGEVGIVFA
jgi:hypothetical protein